jgi:hypothetical protein
LQEWALDKFGVALSLPTALILNKDATEIFRTIAPDSYAYLQSPVSTYMDLPRFAGISGDFPTLPTVLVDDEYVCPETDVFLYSLPGQTGTFGEFSVSELGLTLTAGMNYIGISYASGTPVWVNYTAESSFNYSSIIPVVKVMYFGSTVYNIPYGQTGYGLPEKLFKVLNRRKTAEIIEAYTFFNSGLYIELGEIVVSNGVEEITCDAMDTESLLNDMYLYYKDGSSVWQTTKVTQFDNLQYQTSGSGLASLSAGEFVVNQIFRVIDNGNLLLFSVLSNKFATLQLAVNSGEITDLPDTIKDSAVCVGRIIVEQNSSSPLVQKVQRIKFGS